MSTTGKLYRANFNAITHHLRQEVRPGVKKGMVAAAIGEAEKTQRGLREAPWAAHPLHRVQRNHAYTSSEWLGMAVLSPSVASGRFSMRTLSNSPRTG